MKNFDSFDKQKYDWENMNDAETLAALLADGGRDAVKRIGELRGVNYRVCRPHGDTEVRVMTMNVLYVWCDERHHDPHRTKYGRRMERTADCINVYMPDFVGLQECHAINRSELTPCLNGVYKYVEFDAPKMNTDFIPILYRSDVWQVEKNGTGEYPSVDCPWGYVWTTFSRITNPDMKFTMMNLHFALESTTKENYPVNQLRYPLAEEINRMIRRQLYERPKVPIAITGDYNTGRDSELYEMMIKDLPMEDAPLLTEDRNMSEEEARRQIDHITVTKDLIDIYDYRKLDYYPDHAVSDHPYFMVDIRYHKKKIT